MTTQNFTIPSTDLKAIALFAAKKDIRDYLQGVHFTHTHGGIVAQATDGHIAASLFVPQAEPAIFQPVIVPLGDIDRLKLTAKGLVDVVVDDGQITLSYNGVRITTQALDTRFPNVMRVTPESASGQPGAFDAALLTRIDKAAKLLTGAKGASLYRLHHNGEDAARVSIPERDDFCGVIMPMRNSTPEPGELPLPTWLTGATL